jgi:hypothetical protein
MTADYLHIVADAVERSMASTAHLIEIRDDAIRKAIAEGWTHQRISDATGLTRGRIGQIATKATP